MDTSSNRKVVWKICRWEILTSKHANLWYNLAEGKDALKSGMFLSGTNRKKGKSMLDFTQKNVNPKNRKTGDCSTRALVSTLGISYDEALRLQVEESLKCYYDPTSKQVMERILKRFGYVKMKQPRKWDNKKYRVDELDEILTARQLENGVLVTVANHHTCVKGDSVIDTWDCRYKSVGNYYVKANM